MRILYHLTVPPSPLAMLDAVVQEVAALRALSEGGGQVIHLYPGRAPGTRLPRRWWGLQHLPFLWRVEKQFDLHHIFNPDPFSFTVLRFLRQPIIYTATAGLGGADREAVQFTARAVYILVVPTWAERTALREWGVSNVAVIRPGIDLARFPPSPPPTGAPFTVLMGSAPWTLEQFESKGIEALLEVAQARADLRLVLLWRGLYFEEIQRRIAQRGLEERVTVINRPVDVNEVLAEVHAAIVLARDARLIKAYPHSLLEALATGRPVLVSRAIPMSTDVEQAGCGVVVETVKAQDVLQAMARLESHYAAYQTAALRAGREFSQQQPVAAYAELYKSIISDQAGHANLSLA
jgi:glycosyltransferase involved in cell wall biosynthesis